MRTSNKKEKEDEENFKGEEVCIMPNVCVCEMTRREQLQ